MAPLKVSCRHALVVGLVLVCLAITASRWLARDVRAQEQLPSTVSSLTEVLHDGDPRSRVEAARALAAMGSSAKDAIPALIKALNDEVADVRHYAAGALSTIGASAVPALREAIQNESEVVRLHAAHALSNIGSAAGAATSALIGALNDKSARVREKAAEALTRIGPPAVSSLIAALENDHERVRSGAAMALGRMESQALDAVPSLSKAVREDDSEDVRANCARALGQMGPEAYAAVPVLRKALSGDASVKVRQAAAVALGKMGPPAKDAVPELMKALADQRQFRGAPEGVYPYAAVALGQIGAAAQTVIPSLVEAMTRARYPDDRDRTAEALERIAQDLQDQAETLSISQLQHVITMLNKALKDLQGQEPLGVRRAVQALEAIHRVKQGDPINRVLQWLAKNPWVAGMAIYVVCALGLWFGMLWLRPLWLLKINEFVKPYTDVALPAWLGGIKVPVSLMLLVGFFHYHPRVLDAWVAAHLGAVRERFARKDTVGDRRVHLPVPVVLDGHTVSTLTGKDLQSTFGRGLGCLLIWGEGGAGKTSLACQVARWAMVEEPDQQPCNHRMIPVLEDAAARLKYLEERLHLVQTIQPAQDFIRIVLDPLTEYLVGLYLVEQYGTSEAAWRAFLADIDAKAKDGTREASIGFLLAVRDGCLARRDDLSMPGFVPDELAKRAGIQVPVQVSPEDFLGIVLQKGAQAGPMFNLQCHLSNPNKEVVTIHRLEAYLTDPYETSFRLTWSLFYAGSNVMRKIADPHPITMPPEESQLLGIQFVGPASIAEYLWPEGRYGFDLRGWLTAAQGPKPPDFTTPCALHVTTEDATNLRYWSAAGNAAWAALGDPDNAVAIPVAIARRSSSSSKLQALGSRLSALSSNCLSHVSSLTTPSPPTCDDVLPSLAAPRPRFGRAFYPSAGLFPG